MEWNMSGQRQVEKRAEESRAGKNKKRASVNPFIQGSGRSLPSDRHLSAKLH